MDAVEPQEEGSSSSRMTTNEEATTSSSHPHQLPLPDPDYKVVDIELWSIYFKLVQENDKLRCQAKELEGQVTRLETKVELLRPCCLVRNCCRVKNWFTKVFCPCFHPSWTKPGQRMAGIEDCCRNCDPTWTDEKRDQPKNNNKA